MSIERNYLNQLNNLLAELEPVKKFRNLPRYNVKNTGKELVFEFLVPCIKKENIGVEYDTKSKNLRIFSKNVQEEEKCDYLIKEFVPNAEFERSINLANYEVEKNGITTNFGLGVLTVVLPLTSKPEEKFTIW